MSWLRCSGGEGGSSPQGRPEITFIDSGLCTATIRDTDIFVTSSGFSLTYSTPKLMFRFTCDDNTYFKLWNDINSNLRYKLYTTDTSVEYINGYGATSIVIPAGDYTLQITSVTNNS